MSSKACWKISRCTPTTSPSGPNRPAAWRSSRFGQPLPSLGIGASLQHYSPLVDDDVQKTWDVPANWKLRAQMPFGANRQPFPEKTFMSDADRFKVFP